MNARITVRDIPAAVAAGLSRHARCQGQSPAGYVGGVTCRSTGGSSIVATLARVEARLAKSPRSIPASEIVNAVKAGLR